MVLHCMGTAQIESIQRTEMFNKKNEGKFKQGENTRKTRWEGEEKAEYVKDNTVAKSHFEILSPNTVLGLETLSEFLKAVFRT